MITKGKNKKISFPAIIFRYSLVMLGLTFLIPANLTAKDGAQSMLELRRLALNFIQEQYTPGTKTSIKFARWDKRLKLSKCDSTKIETFYPGKQHRLGYVSIGLRCHDKKPWTIYLRAHISMQQNIVHAKHLISRGTVITKSDLVVDSIKVFSSNSRYFESTNDIIGKVAKRSIARGKKITAASLKPAIIIKRGQQVMIIAKISGLLIRTKGKALSDGVKGQLVKVENNRSKRELQATVIAPNTVKVNM